MSGFKYINSGYNVAEPKGLVFTWVKEQHSFLYFQSKVLINGIEYSPGCCILYKTGTPHNYETLDGFLNSFVGFRCPDGLLEKLNIITDEVFYPSDCSEINRVIFEMSYEKTVRDDCFEEIMQAKILELLVAITRGTRADFSTKDREVENKLLYIRNEYLSNIAEPPSFEELLKKYGFSRTLGYNLYSKVFHSTPKEDLIWARLEKSRDLMRLNPGMKLYEISDLCGFVNSSHYLRTFKNRYGYTPGEYMSALKKSGEKAE